MKKKAKIQNLSQWLIWKTDSEAYRAGRLTGWKHPVIDKDLIAAVGGMKKLLQQAKELEQDLILGQTGKIRFDWRDMGNDIRKIDYEVSIIPELCKREGIVDPAKYQQELIDRVERWKEQVCDGEWILPYYEDILEKLRAGKVVSDAEDELWLKCLNAAVEQKTFVWERVFSARVFNDSKKFQKSGYRGRVITALQNYSPYYEEGMDEEETLAAHGIHSYAQTLEWKGPLQYRIDEELAVDTACNRYGTVLNSQTIEHSVPAALPGCKKIMTIENKANYENMDYTADTLYIFCHGYFTPKEARFLRKIEEIADSDCEFYHWGDMDYGGISIFQFIKKNIFPKLMPYKMDAECFREAIKAGGGIELEAGTRKKLEAKDAGVLSELKNVILETNKTIEQERLL